MDYKHIFHIISLMWMAILMSCSSDNEPSLYDGKIQKIPDNYVAYTIQLNAADNLNTRSGATLLKNDDGTYSFSREINKIWNAVYYDGGLLDDAITNSTKPINVSNGLFTYELYIRKDLDPTKVKLFFWAGNADDKVTTDNVTSVSDGINLNFAERCVAIDPLYLNSEDGKIQYDSFYGYFQLAANTNVTDFKVGYTLKRPFAQIHILSDEFEDSLIKQYYQDGVVSRIGFGYAEANSSNYQSQMQLPTAWFYDNALTLNYKQNEVIFAQSNYKFSTALSGNWPYYTTFKSKPYYYLGCFLSFAPNSGFMTAPSSINSSRKYSYLNIACGHTGDTQIANFHFNPVKIESTTANFTANNRYIVYGSGFVSSNPSIDVIINDIYKGTLNNQN